MSRPDAGGDGLRELFQGLSRKTAPGEVCPTPEELWASARGELPPDENRRIIDHTGRCPSCAEDWRLARFVGRRMAESEGGVRRSRDREARPRRWLVAAAAALVVALGGAGVFLWQEADERRTYRQEQEPGQAIESLVPEAEPLPRTDPTLRWSGPEGASYSLVVTTTRLEVLARAEGLTEAEYTLPQEPVASLEPGTVLLWHVEATLPDGARVPSRTFRVEVE